MTDLAIVLPAFATQLYAHLIPSLEKHHVTTTDLLTLDGIEIAKRAQLPILAAKGLCRAVLQELQRSLGAGDTSDSPPKLRKTGTEVIESWDTISSLDDAIDVALSGGIPTGYVTEVTGER
jgi:DNA repair protein RAD57